MQRWMSREELVQQVVTLRQQGLGRNAIARALEVSKNTVGKLLRAHEQSRAEPHAALRPPPSRAPRGSKLDAHLPRIEELMGRFADITAQRIFEELKSAGYDGGYTAVKEHVRRVRPRPKPEPSYAVPATGPGALAESDWTPWVIRYTTGQTQKVQFFDYVLRYSTRKSFWVYARCDLHAAMDGHVRTFDRFQGAAAECKYDTQKPVILGWEGEQPIYNPRFLAFSAFYEFRPVACRRGKPNDKPRAERSFYELEMSFLNGREFRDLDDLRRQLDRWMSTICDPRPHRKLEQPRMVLFAQEQAALRPLPRHPYDTARVVYALCSIDGFVCWDGNRYAVPYDHITDFLPLRITQEELFIYGADLSLVARYALAPKGGQRDLDPQQLHHRHPRQAATDLEQLERVFCQLGQHGAQYFVDLKRQAGRHAGHQARQILLLRQRFASDDLETALRDAARFGAFDHRAVERILATRARPRRLAHYTAELVMQRHGDAVRSASTGPRDLSEYDQLPANTPPDPEDTP